METEKLLLMALMFDLFFRHSGLWHILLGSLFHLSVFSQSNRFYLDTAGVITVEGAFVSALQHEPFRPVVDTSHNILYCHIGNSSQELYILEVNLQNFKHSVLRIQLQTDLDFRIGLCRLAVNYPKNRLYLSLGTEVLEIDPVTLESSKISLPQSDYLHCENNNTIIGNYGRYNRRETAEVRMLSGSQEIKRIHFPTEDAAMTAFSAKNLIQVTPQYIYWCHVSRPVLFRYDRDANFVDSTIFDVGWIRPKELLTQTKYREIQRKDIYSFYMQGLKDTLKINQALHVVDDSTLLVCSMKQIDSLVYYVLRAKGRQPLNVIDKSTFAINNKCTANNDCHFYGQETSGTVAHRRLFYLQAGEPSLPWGPKSMVGNFDKEAYLHLYIFNLE